MSEREWLKVDFATGAVTLSRTSTTAESVEERFEGLKAEAEEQMPGAAVSVMSVRCDGCQRVVVVEKPELPEGWTTCERGEFCPECSG